MSPIVTSSGVLFRRSVRVRERPQHGHRIADNHQLFSAITSSYFVQHLGPSDVPDRPCERRCFPTVRLAPPKPSEITRSYMTQKFVNQMPLLVICLRTYLGARARD